MDLINCCMTHPDILLIVGICHSCIQIGHIPLYRPSLMLSFGGLDVGKFVIDAKFASFCHHCRNCRKNADNSNDRNMTPLRMAVLLNFPVNKSVQVHVTWASGGK